MKFWTNLFDYKKTYQKPSKPISSQKPIKPHWNQQERQEIHLSKTLTQLKQINHHKQTKHRLPIKND